VRAAGLALVLSLGCAQSEQLTFIPELDGASTADAALANGGNPGATGGAPAGGSDGSSSGGMTTGGFGSGGMSTAGSGSGGMSGGGSVGTGGDGAGGSAGGAAGHLGSGGSAGNSGGASGGHKGTGGTAGHAGAGGTGGHAGGGTTGTDGGPAATFTQVYTMVLDGPSSSPSSCAGNGCHVSAAGAAGISFDTQAHAYQTLLGGAVVPGNPAKSVLYTNIASGAMPRGRPKLSATLIALVFSWINAGALND
jgi:hypothetical protein